MLSGMARNEICPGQYVACHAHRQPDITRGPKSCVAVVLSQPRPSAIKTFLALAISVAMPCLEANRCPVGSCRRRGQKGENNRHRATSLPSRPPVSPVFCCCHKTSLRHLGPRQGRRCLHDLVTCATARIACSSVPKPRKPPTTLPEDSRLRSDDPIPRGRARHAITEAVFKRCSSCDTVKKHNLL